MNFRIVVFIGLILQASTSYATNIAWVDIPKFATLSDNTQLQLNGAGIRTKFFFDIYVGALYLIKPTTSVDTILTSGDANRVSMHFLYKQLAKHKLTDAWVEGFKENNNDENFKKLKSRLDTFNAIFSDTKKGDTILLDYLPTKGTEIWFNGELKGLIPGADFNNALLKVWLGEAPADSNLKDAMINDEH